MKVRRAGHHFESKTQMVHHVSQCFYVFEIPILHCMLFLLSMVKLAIISKTDQEASFLGQLVCLSSSSLHSSRKQLYRLSISSYKLSVKSILYLICIPF